MDNENTTQKPAKVKFHVECMECGKKFRTTNPMPECPKCGGVDVEPAEVA